MRKQKGNKVIFFASILIVVAIFLIIGAAYSFFTSNDVVRNSLTMGNPDIDLVEPNWNPANAKNVTPGMVFLKDPILKGIKGDNYGRIVVEFYDLDDDEIITDLRRINKIKSLIYFDKTYNKNNNPITSTINPTSNYSLNELNSFITSGKVYNFYNKDDFILDTKRSTDTTFIFNYKRVLHENDEKVLFSNIAIPINYTNEDVNLIGNFKIKVYAEAIQSENIGSMEEAFRALDGDKSE